MAKSEAAVPLDENTLHRQERPRLAREAAELDPDFEKALAEEGLSGDVSGWPEY